MTTPGLPPTPPAIVENFQDAAFAATQDDQRREQMLREIGRVATQGIAQIEPNPWNS